MEAKADIKVHSSIDRDSTVNDQDHWIHGMKYWLLLDEKVSRDLSDNILEELCLLHFFENQRSVWELALENSQEAEEDDDPYLSYGDSYECLAKLQKINEEIEDCKNNLSVFEKKNPEVFELVEKYFQNILQIIQYQNQFSHHLEDHEVHDDDASN